MFWYTQSYAPTGTPQHVIPGAEQLDLYLPRLKNKKVALLVHQASTVQGTPLVDVLLEKGIRIQKIFTPEHGLRGSAAETAPVPDTIDPTTGIPIFSLYGKRYRPGSELLTGVDIVVVDLQDVGVRFYTYLTTLQYTMEDCAAAQVPLLLLDRPNPNGHYIDGPILDTRFKSLLGRIPIPLVYGLTIGELAYMIQGEGWLNSPCALAVIPLKNYTHATPYSLPIRPSPNLPNDQAIVLYPSLGLFEGTSMSVGRGTDLPFQVLGYPAASFGNFQFIPRSKEGLAYTPKYANKLCWGIDLHTTVPPQDRIAIHYLIHFYHLAKEQGLDFFGPTFDMHAGSDVLRKQLEAGYTEEAIRASWQEDLDNYQAKTKQYRLYP